jgi:hypothetical protein
MAIVVDAIERLTGRTVTNFSGDISNEFNDVTPPFRSFDSATAVVFISFIVRVVASLNHSFPNTVERMQFPIFSVTVAIKPRSATARADVIAQKIMGSDELYIAAIALAKPQYVPVRSFGRWPDCNQMTETLACDINRCGHRTAPTVRVSSGGMARPTPSRCAL